MRMPGASQSRDSGKERKEGRKGKRTEADGRRQLWREGREPPERTTTKIDKTSTGCVPTAITVASSRRNAEVIMADERFSLSRNSVADNPNPLADDDDFYDDNDTASQRSISLSSPSPSPGPVPESFTSPPMSPASPEAFVRAFELDAEQDSLEPDLPSAYSPDVATLRWNQPPVQALTPAIESAFVGQSSHMYPPTPADTHGDTDSLASFATGSSTSKKVQRESLLLSPPDGSLVLGIALVDFNHIVGPKIEFHEGEIFEDEEISKILPFLALPDGAHLVINSVVKNSCRTYPDKRSPT